jgi:lipopolysaccharide transport system ATP-binding protein
MQTAIRIRELSKAYRLGQFSARTFGQDVKRRLALLRGREDPMLATGEVNDRTRRGTSDVVWSLKDLTFDIPQGVSMGVVGANGAGKSTLLKILSRITSPTAGEIRMRGKVASLLEVGTGFHPELTGRENVFLNGTILGMRKRDITRRFDEIVDFSGVERYIDTPVKRYSSGMYVRLAFAVAAHFDSDILLVDEVLAVGDAEFQKKCLGKMSADRRDSGRTILFVSHNQQAIRQTCNRAIMLEKGQLVAVGTTEEILRKYLGQDQARAHAVVFPEHINHGNEFVRIDSVRIVGADRRPVDSVRISKTHLLEVGYTVKSRAKVNLAFNLLAGDGAEVFGSLNNHEPNFYGRDQEPGRYKSFITIPGDFLNAGTYTVMISSYMPYGANFAIEGLLSFDAEDDGVLKADFLGGFGGYVRPRLQWVTERS